MINRSRDEHGRFQSGEVFTDDEFLEAVSDLEMPTTGDIAREIGCERTTALKRLRELEEKSAVSSRKVGKANVWSVD